MPAVTVLACLCCFLGVVDAEVRGSRSIGGPPTRARLVPPSYDAVVLARVHRHVHERMKEEKMLEFNWTVSTAR